MKREDEEQQITATASAMLDQRLAELDDETIARLSSARRNALLHLSPERPRWIVMGGWAAAAASFLLVLTLWNTNDRPPAVPVILEDLELLSTNEDMKFIEDLDFYLWLDDEQQVG